MEKAECSDEAEDFDKCLSSLEALGGGAKREKSKRRFSDEQVRLLESIFEAEPKLEPRKKLQIARELGLQPRQVAIWFQNRRARWKSKRIEQNFRTLKDEYDSLAAGFESLKEEKQSLIMQLQKLHDLVGKQEDGNKEGQVRSSYSQEELEQRRVMESHKKNSSNDVGDEGHELLNIGHIDASVTAQDWLHKLDSGILFDPSRCSSHWLNFWTSN